VTASILWKSEMLHIPQILPDSADMRRDGAHTDIDRPED